MIFNNFFKKLSLKKLAIAFANDLEPRISFATNLNSCIFDFANKQKFK